MEYKRLNELCIPFSSNISMNKLEHNFGEYPLYGASGLVKAPEAGDQEKFLRGDGNWATVSTTDTKNTAGATDTSSKIFLVGATSQGSNKTTYSHEEVYVDTDHHIYSNNKQVVNLSDTQALTNKTYNGYTLGDACAKEVDTTVTSGSTKLPTSGAVYTAIDGAKSYTDTKTSGLASTTSVTNAVSTHNTNTSAHNDIRTTLNDLNTKVNNFLNVTDTTKD
jgi:hypothetical protein